MSFKPKHITPEELEAIERYLRGRMNDSDRADFEERMNKDEQFQKTVAYYAGLMEGIETASLKSRLDDYHAEVESVEKTTSSQPADSTKRYPFVKYLVAASLLFVVGLTAWIIAFQQNSQHQLFVAYFEPDPGLITPMSSTDQYEFYSGMIDYKRENYRQAIAKWEPLLKENSRSDTLNYFLGVAELASGSENEAMPYLKNTLETSESAFINEAYFYLGLAYLKDGNIEAALEALQQSDLEQAAELRAKLASEK